MSKHRLQTIFEAMGMPVRDYSGRGMYGKTCLGVETDMGSVHLLTSILDDIQSLAHTGEDLDQDQENPDQENPDQEPENPDLELLIETIRMVSAAFRNAREDTMGRRNIVYFPGISFLDSAS